MELNDMVAALTDIVAAYDMKISTAPKEVEAVTGLDSNGRSFVRPRKSVATSP